MVKHKKVLGIDPAYAKSCAWAMFVDDRIRKDGYGTFKRMSQLEKIILLHNPDLIAVEDTYFNAADNNPGVVKKMSKVVGKIEGVAERLDIKIIDVYASVWMGAIRANVPRSKDRDNWIISVAKGLITEYPAGYSLSIDIACAINIAAWAARHR